MINRNVIVICIVALVIAIAGFHCEIDSKLIKCKIGVCREMKTKVK